MNLFVLDHDFEKNSEYHVDKHVVKMILEASQLLCTAFWEQGIPAPYKATHKNHPCSVWVRESEGNFNWCVSYAFALCFEYKHRYGKIHKCRDNALSYIIANKNKLTFPNLKLTPFALAMPDQYKDNDAVKAYRNYYLGEKRHLFSWKNRPTPDWIN